MPYFDPNVSCPASDVAKYHTVADYGDAKELETFAKKVDIITFEFENIPVQSLEQLTKFCIIRPNTNSLKISQSRILEKKFFNDLGLHTAPFTEVNETKELRTALKLIGTPAILKTNTLGYDGKGQSTINNFDELKDSFYKLGKKSCILERKILLDKEISIIICRSADGKVVSYDPGENIHTKGILRKTEVPANISTEIKIEAVIQAGKILNSLDYIGIMGIEFFLHDNKLIINEMAPRVHNSGHWTQSGCTIDQFEQHIRAICKFPLGDGRRHSSIIMENIIGNSGKQFLMDQNISLHLYGKTEANEGRKMGHVNRIKKMGM